MINLKSKIYLAGHKGLVGSSILRKLRSSGYKNIIFKSRKQLDLKNQKKVLQFLKKNKPDFIFIAAAKVGGIYSNNNYKAEYIFDNLSIQSNLIHSAYLSGVKNLIFLGSSCVYPRMSKQPIKESYLLTGELEKTNDAYAIAKIAGIKMCESYNDQYNTNYKCLMPTNTFGPNDNYDELNSHMFPALIKKAHEAKIKNKKEFIIWGNGLAKREVIYVDDIADACIYFMKKKFKETMINIGTGKDYSINQYAKLVLKTIIPNNKIKIRYDLSKPSGTPKKVLDVSLAKKYGWKSKTNLKNSILKTYEYFLKNKT
ncbi:GDP-L-fucose synthase [Candidatus Pelagibacter sp.]|jgi:GDP-L-fucose synthase|nr:GDP-L-fucose synthase [Candidatus Pelagibacter sp.]|tara:strand:- start:62 stop:1000 length:939 start_codon:yes stop_codon:yes gene_type:complete